jgi:hypothetical protein
MNKVRFRILFGIVVSIIMVINSLSAQEIDTRRWSIAYWQKLVQQGLITIAPPDETAPRIPHKIDSKIYAKSVLTDDSPDVPVTTITNTTQSENSIFINPVNDQEVLNSNNSTDLPISFIGNSQFATTDGGLNWNGTLRAVTETRGDPAVAIDLNQRFYVGNLTDVNFGQGVAYSTDHGANWTHVQVYPADTDKNHLWVDNSLTSPYEGNLYDVWTDFSGGANDGEIAVSRSTDSGLSWSSAVIISSAVNAGSHNQGVNVQTGPNGEVYVLWAIYDAWPAVENALGFAKSTDGGATWAPATRILSNIAGIRDAGPGGGLGGGKTMRCASFPSMTVSGSGDIYAVWPNQGVPGVNNGDPDVYMIKSADEGNTWGTPSRVNQDPIGNGKDQWHPWIACDPSTGFLACVFYDSRDFAANDQAETFVATSTDQGNTWEDFKVSDVPWSGDGSPLFAGGYAGDYIGVDILNGRVYPVWTDDRTGNLMSWVSPLLLADPTDPNPPSEFEVYSDYTTPTSMALTWADPTTLANGDTLLPADFQINILRDNVTIDSVSGGTEQYTDNGLTDGVLYTYTLFTKVLTNDSTSLGVNASWHAGGAPTPAAPDSLVLAADTVQAVLTWSDPTTQNDGTPLDDLDSLLVYRDGVHIASLDPGVETYTDTPLPGFVYTYTVKAKDNESPPNISGPSNEASGFVGTTPDMLVWVGPNAIGASAASGDSLYEALLANGESTFLTNNLFEFGQDLSIYEAVFVVLGIFSNNHVLGSSDPEAAALEAYLQSGGRLFLEGGDCFNYDPGVGGYDIRPWFDLDAGGDGSADLFGVVGLNDLSTFSFTYSGENNFMDELLPFNSTPVWQNNSNTDISGVFSVYGSARTIGVVPSFGGFDNSSLASNKKQRMAPGNSRVVIKDIPKVRIRHERNEEFVKKAGYYPELKKNRKGDREYFEITNNGIRILANNKVDLMAAYLAFFQATPGSPVIALSDTVFSDTLLIGGTSTETLTITNNSGTLGGELTYSIAENPEVTWLSITPAAGTLTANQSEDITLSIDASGLTAGDYTTTLDITSNDPLNPLVNAVVNLQANDAPAIRIAHDSLFFALGPGEQDSLPFMIYNDGAGPLQILSIEDEEATAQINFKPKWTQKQRPVIQYAKGEEPASDGAEQTEGAGGPDPFGYTWIDSDEPGGPPYVFTDISGSGTLVNLLPTGIFDPKDEGMATINMPFSVNFYGNSYNTLQVNSNGAVMFDMSFFNDMYSNVGIPSIDPPQLLVCPFWDDLDGSAGGDIYYQQIGNQFIIQWNNWGHYPSGTENMIFQVVFFQNSSTIWFVYENITDQGDATFGIENGDGTVGLEIAYNLVYAHNQLLTKISLGADWLVENPTSGTVLPGDSLEVQASVNSSNLLGGDYLANIVINSNDPINPTVKSPLVKLSVFGIANIVTAPDTVNFDTTFVNDSTDASLTVENNGSGVLTVSNVISTNSAFIADMTSFTVSPLSSVDLTVKFAPTTPGTETGWIIIASDDPDTPLDSTSVEGTAVFGPQIAVNPSSITDSVAINDSMDVSIEIHNNATSGAAALDWSASVSITKNKRLHIPAASPNFLHGEYAPSMGVAPADGHGSIAPSYPPFNTALSFGSAWSIEQANGFVTYFDLIIPQVLNNLGPDPTDVDFDNAGDFGPGDQTFFYSLGGGTSGELMKVDTTTGAGTVLGHILASGAETWAGMATDPTDGTIYAVGLQLNVGSTLYIIDPDNLTATPVGPVGAPGIISLAIDGNGDMWAHDLVTDNFLSIDKSTGASTVVGTLGFDANYGQGMTWDPETDQLFMAAFNNATFVPELRIVDRSTGGSTLVGVLGQAVPGGLCQLGFLAVPGGGGPTWIVLMGVTSGSVDPGDVANLDVRIYGLDVVDTTYTADIEIESNDPVNPLVTIPVEIKAVQSTGIGDQNSLPSTFAISQNYPNPFNPTTTFNYQLPRVSDVKLIIYNVLGQKVRTLINQSVEPGYHTVEWNGLNDSGTQVATGLYIYRFQAGDYTKTIKMMMLK